MTRRSATLAILCALALTAVLVACSLIPRPLKGLPPDPAWVSLPLRKWLAEDRGEPEAMALCRPPSCGPGLLVAVVRLTGEDARRTQALLARPDPLVRSLGRTRKTSATARPLQEGGATGCLLALAPVDGGRPPAFGGALGRRDGDGLRGVIVIGESEDAAAPTLRSVAAEHLGG